jgi:hypothetical protein
VVAAPEGRAVIESWRGLGIAAAIAVVLAVLAIGDIARRAVPVDRALVPGFEPAAATALIWERAGQPAIRVERSASGWELRGEGSGSTRVPADAGAIGEVLAALRGARWHREGDAPPPHATLTVIAGAAHHVIGIAAAIAGTEQSWLVDDGRGVIVDSWVARALDRDRLSLQIRRPFGDLGAARTIEVSGAIATGSVDLAITGAPRRLVRPHALLLAAAVGDALDRALRDVTIVRRPDSAPGPGRLAIGVAAAPSQPEVRAALAGDCPGDRQLVAVTGSFGDGCIERAVASAIQAAIAQLAQPPAAIVEARPLPVAPRQIVLADGATLATSPPRIGDAPADASRVFELVAALAAPAEVVRLPTAPPIGHLVATDGNGSATTLDLFGDRVLARHGEPVALRLPPGAWRLVTRPSRELRDLTLWLEEPTTITAVDIDGVAYQRGQVIGAWTRRTGAGSAADAARLEALVAQLAAPHATGFADGGFVPVHHLVIDVTPPAGGPVRHVLELGPPRPTGCPARAGGDPVLLPAALCAAVAALSRG